MIAIPTAIAEQFDQLLIGKSLPHTVRFSYRKWLRFYCTSSQPLLDKSQHKVNVSGFDDASRDDASSRVVANPAKANSSPAQTGAS